MLKRYSRGEVPRIDWLDPLTFAELDRLRLEVRRPEPCHHRQTAQHVTLFSAATLNTSSARTSVHPLRMQSRAGGNDNLREQMLCGPNLVSNS